MFERNKIDNSHQLTTVPAEITLDDGNIVKGRFVLNANRPIGDLLNGDTHFFDFETYTGERALISRNAIRTVKLLQIPNVQNYEVRLKDVNGFDPYAILGVQNTAAWDDIRSAYVKLSKVYHPDKFTAQDLPAEVRDYLSAMARRINSAYHALEAPVLAQRRMGLNKAQPIFTSQPRA